MVNPVRVDYLFRFKNIVVFAIAGLIAKAPFNAPATCRQVENAAIFERARFSKSQETLLERDE